MSFGDIAQSGFYGREYGGVYLDGVIVAVVYMIVWRLVKKKSEENTRFPPTSLFLLKTDAKKSPTFIGKSRLKVYS